MPGVDFARLRLQISLLDVLTLLHFQPVSRTETQLRGRCPFGCNRSGRTFVAYLDSQRYYCHSCHRSGRALDLWAALQRLSDYDAAYDLCSRLGMETPLIHRW